MELDTAEMEDSPVSAGDATVESGAGGGGGSRDGGGTGEEDEEVMVLEDGSGNSDQVSDKKAADRVKGPWSPEEDAILSRLVSNFGPRNWSLIARGISGRSGKSCRLRWCNQLDPAVKRKPFTGNYQFHFPSNVFRNFTNFNQHRAKCTKPLVREIGFDNFVDSAITSMWM